MLKSVRKGVGYWIQSKEREQVTDGRVEVEISFVSHVLNFQLKFVKSTTFSCKIYNPHLWLEYLSIGIITSFEKQFLLLMSYKSYKYSLGTSNNAREYNWTTAGTVTLLKTRKITTGRFAVWLLIYRRKCLNFLP